MTPKADIQLPSAVTIFPFPLDSSSSFLAISGQQRHGRDSSDEALPCTTALVLCQVKQATNHCVAWPVEEAIGVRRRLAGNPQVPSGSNPAINLGFDVDSII
ncbi:hypothetical protein J3458_000908 [Metarhizium acridum]|uniref:uncharacterized protein n=1 Tax=Metarhizium acridum TaxID=92637 RepID=UPI001C6C9AAD|nr:hypothetical protein J3458_000908 [Metarhizium acridum]